MKKLLILICIVMLGKANINAQITLEHTLDSVTTGGQFYCTDLGNNDFKYVFLDSTLKGFHLYNMDMTLYKTVLIPLPLSTSWIYDGWTVVYITKSLFDCDSTNIEYVFQHPINSGLNDPFYVFRTDGTLVFKADSSNGPYCFGCYGGVYDIRPIQNTSSGAKLFLQYRNSQFWSGIRIYSLCGTLPSDIYDFSERKQFVKIFPNPASQQLNFEIMLPNNQEEFELTLYDVNARQKKESISVNNSKVSIDVSYFSSGVYSYSLSTKKKIYESGKFIITK